MMDQFNFRHRTPAPRHVSVAVAVVVVLILGFVLAPYVRDAVAPLLSSAGEAGQYALLPRDALIERLVVAEGELQRTRYQAILFDATYDEIRELQSELGLRPTEAYVSARVVASPPRSHYDTLLIAAGEDEGVRMNDVVSAGGVALGVVTDVSRTSAVVQLFSSPGAERDVYLGEPRAIVVMRGLGGGSLEASVPDDIELLPGEAVIDANTGLMFATVGSVTRRDIDTTALVRAHLPVQPATLRLVSLTHTEL